MKKNGINHIEGAQHLRDGRPTMIALKSKLLSLDIKSGLIERLSEETMEKLLIAFVEVYKAELIVEAKGKKVEISTEIKKMNKKLNAVAPKESADNAIPALLKRAREYLDGKGGDTRLDDVVDSQKVDGTFTEETELKQTQEKLQKEVEQFIQKVNEEIEKFYEECEIFTQNDNNQILELAETHLNAGTDGSAPSRIFNSLSSAEQQAIIKATTLLSALHRQLGFGKEAGKIIFTSQTRLDESQPAIGIDFSKITEKTDLQDALRTIGDFRLRNLGNFNESMGDASDAAKLLTRKKANESLLEAFYILKKIVKKEEYMEKTLLIHE